MRIHGRGVEQAQIGALLESARAGTGGVLVVRGEPGVGKSALLADAVAPLLVDPSVTVLRTQGIESEAPLPFAALQRLLRPLMRRHADDIAAPQAHALRVAFGEEVHDQDGSPRGAFGAGFGVCLATLNLVSAAAETQPVVAVIDDAHWLDEASAAALLFAARRLNMERVALLFGARDGDVRTFDAGDLPTLLLGGLDRTAVGDLLADRSGGVVSPEVSAQLLAATGGNPLALVELPEVLTAGQLEGSAPLPGRLPVTGGVERVFAERAERLGSDAQRLLLIAATDDSTEIAVIRAAARALGVDPDALDEVERSGLVTVTDGVLEMRHPLVRSAIYTGATTVARRATHQALADALTPDPVAASQASTAVSGRADPDRRAWHRAAAADEPDESVVADLDEAAARAHRRGAHEAAARAYERASELTTDTEGRARRLYLAARCAWLTGQPVRARGLSEAALVHVTDPGLRADIARLRARVEWNTGSVQLGHRMILQAAAEVASHDPARAREMAMFAAAIAAFGGDSGIDVRPLDFANPPGPGAPAREQAFADLLIGLDHVVHDRWNDAATVMERLFATAEVLDADDQDLLPNLGIAALHVGDDAAASEYHRRLLSRARDTGAMVMVLYAQTRLALTDVATGAWSSAEARCAEAVALGEETGQPVLATMPKALQLLIAARRASGAYEPLLVEVEAALGAQAVGILDGICRDLVRWAKGLHALGSGAKPTAAFHQFGQISHDITKRMAGVDRVETAVAAGQDAAARLWVEDLATFADATGQAWARAAAAHALALVDPDRAEEHFEAALAAHPNSGGRVFDRARTHLAYGEWLRRNRRRVDAREQLRVALATFEDLDAKSWADRAAAELRASGETARKRDDFEPLKLTAQELAVATQVQQGLSNREVAAQLFLSPRTVDFHLRNVFAKTGVTSRVELAQLALT